jgi:hypothetical protein
MTSNDVALLTLYFLFFAPSAVNGVDSLYSLHVPARFFARIFNSYSWPAAMPGIVYSVLRP